MHYLFLQEKEKVYKRKEIAKWNLRRDIILVLSNEHEEELKFPKDIYLDKRDEAACIVRLIGKI